MKKRDVHRPAVNGRIGEDLTVYYLTKKGYNILCRNYRIRGAEIDIIAENGEFIIFVEVKSRGCIPRPVRKDTQGGRDLSVPQSL